MNTLTYNKHLSNLLIGECDDWCCKNCSMGYEYYGRCTSIARELKR